MEKIIIKGILKTVGPLSIKLPRVEGSRDNEFGNFPVQTRGLDADGNKQRTAYLPATTLRGFLRRAATLRRMQAAADAGKPYRLPQIYSEMIGQDAESEKQAGDIDLLALQQARQASPVLDLFGSGLGIKSRLKVSHFVPTVNVLPDVFTGVRKDLDDTEEALALMEPSDMQAFLGRSTSNNQRATAAALVKQLETQVRRLHKKNEPIPDDIAQALQAAKANEEKHKIEMGDMRNSTRTIVQHFALPAGIELNGKIVVEHATAQDLEMLEHGLNTLSQHPVLGAHSARGCGEVEGVFQVFNQDGKLLKTVAIGDYAPARVTDFSAKI
jgi:CRISPR type IV-associated protein Csf2